MIWTYSKNFAGSMPMYPHDNQAIHFSLLLRIASEIAFATTRSACTEGCSSSNLDRPISTARHELGYDAPEEAILVTSNRIRADPRIGPALVELEDAGVDSAGDVQRSRAVQIELRTVNHVHEQAVRVKESYGAAR